MADISTLNGYNLKDAQARSDISTINGKIGSANGIAELDGNGLVPATQLPSYVDDVLEYASQSAFPATGETGKIYIALDTNKTFRWSGSAYVEISESLALGETSSTAYAGSKGKANADAIAAMKDGSSIDSFGDVENALAGKADKFGVDGSTIDWLTGVGVPDKLYVIDHDEIPQENEWISGLPNDEAVRKAVKSAYNLMKDTVGWNGKNKLMPNPTKTETSQGITFTTNADNSITMVGTTNATAVYRWRITLPAGRYKLHGRLSDTIWVGLYDFSTGQYKVSNINADDTEFTLDQETTYGFTVRVGTPNVIEAPGLTIYPMIVDKNCLDLSYEPYRGTTAFPRDEQRVLGAKNLLKNTATSQTKNNIVYVVNEDKTISVADNQTSDKYSNITVMENTVLPEDDYILSGCPVGGSSNTYRLRLVKNGSLLQSETGEGYQFSANGTDTYSVTLAIGTSSSDVPIPTGGLVFKPMLRLATDPDDTYVPYAMTNRELTDSKFPRSEQAVLGAKNLLPVENYQGDLNGITYDISDGIVSMSGTSTAATGRSFGNFTFKGGVTYYLSGNTSDNSNIWLGVYNTSTTRYDYAQGANSSKVIAIKYDEDTTRRINIRVGVGETITNLQMKPMIALSSDEIFVSYTMTNKELTEKATVKQGLAISFEQGLSAVNTNYLSKVGNIVDITLQLHGISDNTHDITLGTIPYLPANSYALFDVLSFSKPYTRLGGGFIRATSGLMVIAKNSDLPTDADVWIKGTYICQ